MIWKDGILYTAGRPVPGDRTRGRLRIWPPERSKFAARCYLGQAPAVSPRDRRLYLGAAAGTTVSFLADIAELVYAVEMAPGPLPRLMDVCRIKKNIIPIQADASRPEQYRMLVGRVDILYQDIAQRDQAGIAIRNLPFLKEGGRLILMLKTRSISGRDSPGDLGEEAGAALSSAGMCDITMTWLDRYHRDHVAIVCRKGEQM